MRLCLDCRTRQVYRATGSPSHKRCLTCHFRWLAESENRAALFVMWWKHDHHRDRVPVVLRPDFRLRGCPVCGDPIEPWKVGDHAKTGAGQWVTVKMYKKANACSKPACKRRVITARRKRRERR